MLFEDPPHPRLHRAGRQMQDAHVLDIGSFPARIAERIVGAAEYQRRKELLAIPVPSESARLAHQRPDHVSVVDAMVLLAAEARHRLGQLAAIPDFDHVGVLPDLDLASDEARGNGVGSFAEVHRAPGADRCGVRRVIGQPRGGQLP
jgi:hypothetical protein